MMAAAKHSDAEAKARELIILLTNFVFMIVVSFCLSFVVLAFFDSSSLSSHFWPFTRSTERKPPRGYDQVWEFFQTRGNKRQGRLYLVPYE